MNQKRLILDGWLSIHWDKLIDDRWDGSVCDLI